MPEKEPVKIRINPPPHKNVPVGIISETVQQLFLLFSGGERVSMKNWADYWKPQKMTKQIQVRAK